MTRKEHQLSHIVNEIIKASENIDFKNLRYLHLYLSLILDI